jgi:hypothetical protein
MADIQIKGFTTANVAEVELNTKALRTTLRPEDVGALGFYSQGIESGVMAAGLAANSPIFMFRWSHATNLAIIKKLIFSAATITAFTAGILRVDAFVARSFSVDDTGGASFLPTGNFNKLRSSFGATLAAGIRASATATLTAGTRTTDTNPIGSAVGGVPATAGVTMIAPSNLLDQRPGEHPLVLAQNEGLIIQATAPAVGTWGFGITIQWGEIAAY